MADDSVNNNSSDSDSAEFHTALDYGEDDPPFLAEELVSQSPCSAFVPHRRFPASGAASMCALSDLGEVANPSEDSTPPSSLSYSTFSQELTPERWDDALKSSSDALNVMNHSLCDSSLASCITQGTAEVESLTGIRDGGKQMAMNRDYCFQRLCSPHRLDSQTVVNCKDRPRGQFEERGVRQSGQGQRQERGQCGHQTGTGQCCHRQCSQEQVYQGQCGQGHIGHQGEPFVTQLYDLKTWNEKSAKSAEQVSCSDKGGQQQQGKSPDLMHHSPNQQRPPDQHGMESAVSESPHAFTPISGPASCPHSNKGPDGSLPFHREQGDGAGERVDVDPVRQPGSREGGTTVEVRGLRKETSQETVDYYFQNSLRSGGGTITQLQWNKTTGVCLLSFESAEVAQSVASREQHTLDGKILTVNMYHVHSGARNPVEKSYVCVKNFDIATTTEDALRNHFENPRNCGGEVTEVEITMDDESVPTAIVTFQNPRDAQTALVRTHKLNGRTLTVMPHTPPPVLPNAVSLHGFNRILQAENIRNYVESLTQCHVYDVLMGRRPYVAVIIFDDDIDFTAVKAIIISTPLLDRQLDVRPVQVTSTVEVHGLPHTPSLCRDTLRHYFENTPRSGGTDVRQVELLPGTKTVLVTFEDTEVCNKVASRHHVFQKKVLDVQLHFPCLGLRGERAEDRSTPPLLRIARLLHQSLIVDPVSLILRSFLPRNI